MYAKSSYSSKFINYFIGELIFIIVIIALIMIMIFYFKYLEFSLYLIEIIINRKLKNLKEFLCATI